jgi:glycosyltransferase involved in cell wall biosynthesis
MAKPLRVLHCPLLVGGNPQQLARAERALGLASWSVAFSQNYIGYECDEILWENERAVLGNEIRRWQLLRRALTDFDVIHFNGGRTILPARIDLAPGPTSKLRGPLRIAYHLYGSLLHHRDLALLKHAGKAIFVTYQGDDARQSDYCRANFDIHFADEVPAGYYSPSSDARKRQEIAIFDRYADGIFALNPDLLNVLPARARFLPYANVDLQKWFPGDYRPGSRPRPVLVHAPSHRGVKGTRYIVDAVNRLKSDGVDFEFVLVEGLPREQARKLYQQADLMVDQLLSGWYGGVAVEMMALGVPVICYLRENDLRFLDTRMRAEMPVINSSPGEIYRTLREWLVDRRQELCEYGARSRKYVACWHNPEKIARDLKSAYEAALAKRAPASE